jgi:hypothetical protein
VAHGRSGGLPEFQQLIAFEITPELKTLRRFNNWPKCVARRQFFTGLQSAERRIELELKAVYLTRQPSAGDKWRGR